MRSLCPGVDLFRFGFSVCGSRHSTLSKDEYKGIFKFNSNISNRFMIRLYSNRAKNNYCR